jgi:hypothetical protein
MPFRPTKKATLLMPSGPPDDPDRLHLWIVLTDPCELNANLIVSVSTLHEHRFHDPACVIAAGEHRRIRWTSWIEYRRAKALHSNALVRGEAAWYYREDQPVTDALFERVCRGLLESKYTPIRLRRYFQGKGPAF